MNISDIYTHMHHGGLGQTYDCNTP